MLIQFEFPTTRNVGEISFDSDKRINSTQQTNLNRYAISGQPKAISHCDIGLLQRYFAQMEVRNQIGQATTSEVTNVAKKVANEKEIYALPTISKKNN